MKHETSRGFAGINKLIPEGEIDHVLRSLAEQADAVTNEPLKDKSETKETVSEVFQGNKRRSWNIPQGYWWIAIVLFVVWLIGNADDSKHSTKPVNSHSAANEYKPPAPVSQPAATLRDPVTDNMQLNNSVPATKEESASSAAVPNYHPHITYYKHSPIYKDFQGKFDEGGTFTAGDFEKFAAEARGQNLDAQFIVGAMKKYGLGTPKDEKSGDYILLGAAQNGQPDAMREVSWTLNNQDLTLKYLMRAALLGDDKAQFFVGKSYYNGSAGEKNYSKAYFWFLQSALQYNSDAQLAISRMYDNGYGLPKDDRKSFDWALKAGRQLNPGACDLLAATYATGAAPAKQDWGAAHYWISCADPKMANYKELNDTIDAHMTEQDYISSAQLGDRTSIIKVAQDYHEGTALPKNDAEAEKYMEMYGHKDNAHANELDAQVLSELTPDQVAKAKADGDAWIASWIKQLFEPIEAKRSYQASLSDPLYIEETLPGVGMYPVLSEKELRWCVYQGKRIEYINHQFPDNDKDTNKLANFNAKYLTPAIVAKSNALVSDFNSRCPSGRNFMQTDMDNINSELTDPIYANQIALDAQKIMLGWDQHFWFRE